MEVTLDDDHVYLTNKKTGARVVVRALGDVFAIQPVLSLRNGSVAAENLSILNPPKAIVTFTKTQIAFLCIAEETLASPGRDTWMRTDWQNLRLENLTFDRARECAQFFQQLKETFNVDFDHQYLDQLQTIGAVYNYVMTLNPNLEIKES